MNNARVAALMVIPAIPGLLFAILAAFLQTGESLDVSPATVGPSFEAIIAGAFLWVFIGPIVIGLSTLIGWRAIKGADPRYRMWWSILTIVSIVGWLLLAEFMRMA